MAAISWAVAADFDFDGTFETDLTGYVERPGQGLKTQRGIGPDGVPRISSLTIDLSNRGGDFTPENTSSSFYGALRPGVPIRITCTHNGSSYTLWTGYAQKWTVAWRAGTVAICQLQCRDIADYLTTSEPVNVLVSTSRDTDGALVSIMDAIGLTSADRQFDDGQQDLPYHWCQAQPAMGAMMDVVRSEMGGLLWVDAFGKLQFEGRQTRRGVGPLQRAIRRLAPVGYWRLGEATGTVAYDLGSAGVNGTYTNSPTLGATGLQSNGDPDTAVTFAAASSQYVSIADNNAWSITAQNQLSIHALAKLTANDTGTNLGIVAKGTVTGNQYEWGLYVQDTGVLVFLIWTPAGGGLVTLTWDGFAAGTTYDVVVTVDMSAIAATVSTMYVNGVQVDTSTDDCTGYANGTGTLRIGEIWNLGMYWKGQIDEVAIFPSALTATQVKDLYRKHTQSAWGDGTAIVPTAIRYAFDAQDYVSTVRVRTTVLQAGQADTELYRFIRGPSASDSKSLTAGEVWQFEADFSAVAISITSPVASQDYFANAAAAGTGTDMTSSLSVTATSLGAGRVRFKLKNTHATDTLYITLFKVRGQAVTWSSDRPQFAFTKAVTGDKAGRDLQVDLPFAGDAAQKPRDYAYHLLRTLRYPFATLSLDFAVGHASAANDSAIKDAILALELGDLVYYADTSLFSGSTPKQGANVADWWYVEAIETSIPPDVAGAMFEATVTLVPSYVYRNVDRIAFDTFDRDNAVGALGTSASNDNWASATGFDINSNKARANSDSLQAPNVDLGTLAFDGVAEVSLAAIGTGDEVGVVYRYVDANNYYRAYVDKGSNEVILEKVVGGVTTELSSPALTVGTSHELRVIWQANRHRVQVDRKTYIDTTDAALNTGTKVGLFARNANATTTFEDFYAEAA